SSSGIYVIRFTGTKAGISEPMITANGSSLTGGTSPSAAVALSNIGGNSDTIATVTDPRGISAKTDVDLLGRTTRSVQGHTSGTPTSIDQTTDYRYDGDNHVVQQIATVGSSHQTTQYDYGYSGSNYPLNSNDILVKVQMPDPTTGDPSTANSNSQSYTFND